MTTIYDIQYTTDANGVSTMESDYVEVSGIVTAVDTIGTNTYFVIQDGSGAWNGIYCHNIRNNQDSIVGLGYDVTVRGRL